jgi:hypothetical protein
MSHFCNCAFFLAICLPGERLYAVVTRAIFEDHHVITAVSLEINNLPMVTHRLHIQNREFAVSFPTEPTSAQDFWNFDGTCFLNSLRCSNVCRSGVGDKEM